MRKADRQTRHHEVSDGEGIISNTKTILDRATKFAESQNIEAETFQAPDRTTTTQKHEIGQRRV